MKRSPLKRTRMRQGKGRGRYAKRPRDLVYMRLVKRLACLVAFSPAFGPCGGEVEADHAGGRGLGQKAPDSTCIPLCTQHHRDRHNTTGGFEVMGKGAGGKVDSRGRTWNMRGWLDAAIEHTQGQVEKRWGVKPIDAMVSDSTTNAFDQ